MEESINLKDVYRELKRIEQLMATKAELNVAFETIAVLFNPNTMSQIIQSEDDIKNKKIKRVVSIDEI